MTTFFVDPEFDKNFFLELVKEITKDHKDISVRLIFSPLGPFTQLRCIVFGPSVEEMNEVAGEIEELIGVLDC